MQAMDAMLARLVGIADKDQLQYVGNMNGYVTDSSIAHSRSSPCSQAVQGYDAWRYNIAQLGWSQAGAKLEA